MSSPTRKKKRVNDAASVISGSIDETNGIDVTPTEKLLRLGEKYIPAGRHYSHHQHNRRFTEYFTTTYHTLSVKEFIQQFEDEGYRMCEYNKTILKWEICDKKRTAELVRKRYYLFRKNKSDELKKSMLETDKKVEEATKRGNFLKNPSSTISSGMKLASGNGTYKNNALMILDYIRNIKLNFPDVGKLPDLIDFNTGEKGFHHHLLSNEANVIMYDKYKNCETMDDDKYKDVKPYPTNWQKQYGKIGLLDLPYLNFTGGHHAGNCDLNESEGFVRMMSRYGVTIPLTPSILLLTHTIMIETIKKVIPADGGWLLVKTMRDEANNFNLTQFVDKILTENGFEEKSRTCLPKESNSTTSIPGIELDKKLHTSTLVAYRTTNTTIDSFGVPNLRVHQYKKIFMKQAMKDINESVEKHTSELEFWMETSETLLDAIVKRTPTHPLLKSAKKFFGKLDEYFDINNNRTILWNVNDGQQSNEQIIDCDSLKKSYDSLEQKAFFNGAMKLKVANIAFILFAEWLRVLYEEKHGNDYSKYDRVKALSLAGLTKEKDHFCNDTVDRLFRNVQWLLGKNK